MNYKEEEGYQQKCCWPFSFFVCKSRIIHKDPFTHIINNLIIMVIRLFKIS